MRSNGVMFLVVLVMFLSSGCASWNPAAYEYSPTVDADAEECRAYGRAHSPENPLIAMDLAQDCMELRGHRRK